MSKKILLIITGSIASYKAVELIRLLQKKSFEISVILTKAAQEFITPLLVSSIAKNKIYTELFDDGDDGMTHIKLSRDHDLIVVAPASADFIAKIVNGYADDLASTVIAASDKKIMVAPAMNEKMWLNQANLDNIGKLYERGVIMASPATDALACGEVGIGKMQEPTEIAAKIDDYFHNSQRLKGIKILLTGGGTREMIDSVRFIGNSSSGKQAIHLAETLSQMGATVDFIAANINLPTPVIRERFYAVTSTDEMLNKVKEKLPNSNVFIGCAAVSDYKVKNPTQTKIKKENQENLTLELVKNVDILDYVGNSPSRPALVIGFAAESENLTMFARDKLKRKNCDLILANDVDGGKIFGSDKSHALLIGKDFTEDLGKIKKREIAKILANKIAKFFSEI